MSPDQAPLFNHGIELFNRQEFFECHEVLEAVWTPTRGPERLFLQGLIHFAVGFYHHQQRNQAGAERQLRKGLQKIDGYLPEFWGIETSRLRDEVASRLLVIERGGDIQGFPRVERANSTG